ncbi:DUF1798 family protein [Virgibacillus flavescens]|uniref:DUF1798 family protein n=1 Tax=Virgibacillus flavescens TaxID=1611422 RepID=UPI003D334778
MKLKEQTIKLKKHLQELKDNYERNDPPENKKDINFFTMVKTNTAPVYTLLEQWESDALEIVKQRKVNVHPHQITSTRENMELLLMHSYYIDAKRKRYMELNHSVLFIFDQLLRELELTDG